MNLSDKIYSEWVKEIDGLVNVEMNPVQVVGELTRALKRVTNRNGGTSIIIDGVHYDQHDNVIPA